MRARYYEPASGRFVSEDDGRKGQNWLTYCDNDPVNRVDQSGRDPINIQNVLESTLGGALWALIAKVWPTVLTITAAGLEAARQEVIKVGYQLITGGYVELQEGAAILRAGEAIEPAPYEMQGVTMMLGGAGKIVAGFAMEQLGLALLLLE